MLAVNLCMSLQFGCASEEYAELKPTTTWVLCKGDYSMSNIGLVYRDCRMVKLSIRSRAYDLQKPFLFRYFVAEPGMVGRVGVIFKIKSSKFIKSTKQLLSVRQALHRKKKQNIISPTSVADSEIV